MCLLENGNLLRQEREPDVAVFSGGGQGGRLREYTWNGEVVWDFLFASEQHLLHHDVEVLPNGNIRAIALEAKMAQEARHVGRAPNRVSEDGIWPDMVIEIEPLPPNDARIVWEWHTWYKTSIRNSQTFPVSRINAPIDLADGTASVGA